MYETIQQNLVSKFNAQHDPLASDLGGYTATIDDLVLTLAGNTLRVRTNEQQNSVIVGRLVDGEFQVEDDEAFNSRRKQIEELMDKLLLA